MAEKILRKSQNVLIKKASGEEEAFSTDKLKRSLVNAGAKEQTILKIAEAIEDWIYPGISTKKIYTQAFSILRRERTAASIRYKLKKAILELGPTGYPFETLIGQLFKRQGFSTEVGVVVNGQFITHEIDVIATQDTTQHLVECKYHKDQGKQVSIQVPLYVRSRVDDIIHNRKELQEFNGFSFSGWVITNTRFSSDSIQYSKGSDLNLLAWDYPRGNGLKEMIERLKIYPITVLNSLAMKQKQELLNQDIITCCQLLENCDVLKSFNFKENKHDIIVAELRSICH